MTPPPKVQKIRDELFSNWWFLNGGMLHRWWKTRQYSKIEEAARSLPKLAHEVGFDAGYAHAMKLAGPLVEALGKIRSGITTDQTKVEYYTKKEAHEALATFKAEMEGEE